MIQTLIAILAICVLALMSAQANRRFEGKDRLPMQWFLDGSVTWTAPRAVALAFIPTLASVVLAATVALTIFAKARPGQEGFEVPVTMFVALVFIGAYALHLWLIAKTLRRSG